jgi:hypothetical protein
MSRAARNGGVEDEVFMDMEILMIGLGAMTLITMLVLLAVAVAVYLQFRRTEGEPGTLQAMRQLIQQQQTQMAMMGEKLAHIEPVIHLMGMLNSEVRGLTERISTVESNQNEVQRGVGSLATDSISALSELKTLTNRLGEATAVMRSELAMTKTDLTELHSRCVHGRKSTFRCPNQSDVWRRSSPAPNPKDPPGEYPGGGVWQAAC